ncbi:MAG: hypothetical protein BGO68_01590 [Candidatus Amoebophilus sp. 36-38]|mgnify:CR=1 FL=1|nr:MAG: hypothetical protein BGO68_01590 [Candidatus Amoebophilus sp. 36-38]
MVSRKPTYDNPIIHKLLPKVIRILLLTLLIASCGPKNSTAPDTTQLLVVESTIEREKGEGSPGGIPNLGATCYMNSVLQILKTFYLPRINEKDDELGKSLQSLMQVIADDKEVANKAEATAVFKALHSQFGWTTDLSEHQDAQELIGHLFDWMNLPTACTQSKFVEPTTHEERSSRSDPWRIHPVALPTEKDKISAMQDLFKQSIAPEDMYVKFRNTDTLDSKVKKFKELKNLDSLYSKILILQLNRFETKGGARLADGTYSKDFTKSKLGQAVQSPMSLVIKKDQTVEKDRKTRYTLAAFILHTGDSADGGHYVAYVKKEGRWICYNDNHVNVVSDAEAENNAKQAYLFFYQPSRPRRAE